MTKQRKKTKNKKLVSMRRFKTRREMNIGILIFRSCIRLSDRYDMDVCDIQKDFRL